MLNNPKMLQAAVHKKISKIKQHQFDWTREGERMMTQRTKVEADLEVHNVDLLESFGNSSISSNKYTRMTILVTLL
jgi:hypothetical protein